MLLMTRKRTTTKARLRVRTSFDGFRIGEEIEATLDGPVAGWVGIGLMEVIEGGKAEAGPSSVESDVPGDEQE
ncbi:hypothetical protein AB0B30_32480 [Streptomyces narbonensis]|uniref:Uncharacterized protein n=1 Tax=Streptomyces narbonensis TaxID=67333 RepID=A0ABV3CIY1_9ACTN